MTARAMPLVFTDSQAREFGAFLVTIGDLPRWKRDLALRQEAARVFGAGHASAVLYATATACCGRAVEMMAGGKSTGGKMEN